MLRIDTSRYAHKFSLRYEIVNTAGVDTTGNKQYYYLLNKRAAEFGYKPALTSLEGILSEMEKILNAIGLGNVNIDYKRCRL